MAVELEGIEKQPIKVFTEQAYLDYAMYVILDRALPHIGDGLKPVQRRIIYAMSELNLKSDAKYKKSARTVGDVLGKFHPHSDAACYEAMVLMAQPFSYRYPFIDGQGNWGSTDDPKSFAAMRYTEAKLSPFAQILLQELEQGTVDWIPNFDGSLKEPKILPARLPNVLLNGSTGIAVGMATDIPPHNATELAKACVLLLDKPKSTLADIMEHVQGPDYPTSAEIITPKEDIYKLYESGQGSIRMRAVYTEESGDIIITALPHMVSGAKVLEQIAQQMQQKKLPLIADLRDESDHENPTRLVIVPRSNRVDTESLMAHLFASTDLERTYRVNLNMIGLDGKPGTRPLLNLLQEWLSFRKQTVSRRLQFRLNKVLDRIHILDGLMIAYLNIDEVIQIIREKDDPKQSLMKKFKLSETQATAILDLKLRHLAKLEEQKIKAEQTQLSEERNTLEALLNSETKLKSLIKKELQTDMKEYGDTRRSPIVKRDEAKVLTMVNSIPSEPVTVILSNKGWVRAGKGHEVDPISLNYKSGDTYKAHIYGKSTDPVVFLDSFGRAYTLLAHTLPSVRGYGEPLTSRVTPESGATFETLLTGREDDKFLLINNAGFGFIVPFEELLGKNKKGKGIMNLPKDAHLLPPILASHLKPTTRIALVTSDGRLLISKSSNIPELSKGKGKKLLGIPTVAFNNQESKLIYAGFINDNDNIVIHAAKKKLILTLPDQKYYDGELGQRGHKLPKGYQAVKSVRFEST